MPQPGPIEAALRAEIQSVADSLRSELQYATAASDSRLTKLGKRNRRMRRTVDDSLRVIEALKNAFIETNTSNEQMQQTINELVLSNSLMKMEIDILRSEVREKRIPLGFLNELRFYGIAVPIAAVTAYAMVGEHRNSFSANIISACVSLVKNKLRIR